MTLAAGPARQRAFLRPEQLHFCVPKRSSLSSGPSSQTERVKSSFILGREVNERDFAIAGNLTPVTSDCRSEAAEMAEELSLDLDSLTIVDEELEQFRQAWKAEVDQRARSHQSEAKEPPAKAGSSSEQRTANKIGIRRTVGAKAESKPATSPAVGAQRSEASKSATSSAGASEPASALDIYDTAVRFEREGNLSKALEHYQRAFRLDDQVDSKWRGLWQRGELEQVMVRKEEEKDQPDFSYHYFERESAPFAFETSATVAQELATTALAFEPKRKNKIVPLAIIPDELILVLLKHVAWMDPYVRSRTFG